MTAAFVHTVTLGFWSAAGSEAPRRFRASHSFLVALAVLSLATTSVFAQEDEKELADDWLNLGPAFDRFRLTIEPGWREEWAGPFYYRQQSESRKLWAVPPLLTYFRDPETESIQANFAYPLFSYAQSGSQYRWHLGQLLSFSGGSTQTADEKRRFTLFPIYFQQRSDDPEDNYTAVVPFYGHLQNRLMRDEIFFVMFPIYSQTRKRDVLTYNYVYPVFHTRKGDGLRGWQVWPLYGHEEKEVTTRVDGFGDTEVIPGHKSRFVLWPFFAEKRSGIGTENPDWQQALLPIYSLQRSPKRDATTILWPFFSRIEDREKKFVEWHAPWPFFITASGEGKTISRFWPFYSHAQSTNKESNFYLWPVYRYTRLQASSVERVRRRVLFFLYSDTRERNLETGDIRRRRDFLPLFTWRQDADSNTRLQVLAPVEPVLAGNRKIELEYSQVWSVWRSENNPTSGASSQSLLWNLYRRDVRPDEKKISCFFGLFQYRRNQEGKAMRVFGIPFGKRSKDKADEEASKFDESIAAGGN